MLSFKWNLETNSINTNDYSPFPPKKSEFINHENPQTLVHFPNSQSQYKGRFKTIQRDMGWDKTQTLKLTDIQPRLQGFRNSKMDP